MGVKEYAGFYTNLFFGFKLEGIKSDLFLYSDHPFEYGAIENESRLLSLIKILNGYRKQTKSRFKKGFFIVATSLLKFLLFSQVCFKYDCFILSASSSIFCKLDLLILKYIFKKKLIITCHGSDVRSPYLDPTLPKTFLLLVFQTLKVKFRVKIIELSADYIINDIGTSGFFKRGLIGHRFLGIPTKMHTLAPNSPKELNQKIFVLHCPSNTNVKGTIEIEDSIARLAAEFPDKLIYERVAGVTHDKLIAKLDKADLVIDQLYSDIFMATLSIECCWRNVPVIVGNVVAIEKWDAIYKQTLGEIPNLFINPNELDNCLRSIIRGEIDLKKISRRQYDYVSTWTPENIARKYLKLIREGATDEQIFWPETGNEYGIGLSVAQINQRKQKYQYSWSWGVGLK